MQRDRKTQIEKEAKTKQKATITENRAETNDTPTNWTNKKTEERESGQKETNFEGVKRLNYRKIKK